MLHGLQEKLTHLNPLTITIIYTFVGVLWVLISDELIFTIIQDEDIVEQVGVFKGWFYVLATASLIYILICYLEKKLRATEGQLREAQRQHLALINNLPGMAYRCENDANWTMLLVSEGVQELTGYMPDDLIGNQNIAYGDLIHPDDRSAILSEVQTALTTQVPFRITYRIINANGQQKWVWEQGSGVYTQIGTVGAIEGFITDITEQKQTELNRTQANETLKQQVAERTQEIEKRRRVAEGLLDILAALNSNLPFDQILQAITKQASHLLDADANAIYRLQEQTGLLTIETAQGLPDAYVANTVIPLGQGALGTAVVNCQPEMIEDVVIALNQSNVNEPIHDILEQLAKHYRAVLAVPLIIRNKVYGGIVLYYTRPRNFSDEDIALAVSFSDQVALAIENARLMTEAEKVAVAVERNRIARELHDAVTQTLFSSTIIAEVLPEIWEVNPDEGRKRLLELREMTRGALAEMRNLLLELRPTTLIEMPLVDLLRQLAEALQGRARIPVEVQVNIQSTLPINIKIIFYRIVQEALHNILKHAKASHVIISLTIQPKQAMIDILDDGVGFDSDDIAPGHFGLKIMKERTSEGNINLTIHSQLGKGTQITGIWYDSQ